MSTTYTGTPHPFIKQEQCERCALGQDRVRRNNEILTEARKEKPSVTVGGAGPVDLTQVQLIVLSDYPGIYEGRSGYPMVDITKTRSDRTNGLLTPFNAGATLRNALTHLFGLGTYEDCWITNAVRCDPGPTQIIVAKHLKPCVQHWLISELLLLDQHCPTAPLLVAGTQAHNAIKLIYGVTKDLNSLRRQLLYLPNGRPVVYTNNPAVPARATPRWITHERFSNRKQHKIPLSNVWLPPLPGSPMWHFIEDLKLLPLTLKS